MVLKIFIVCALKSVYGGRLHTLRTGFTVYGGDWTEKLWGYLHNKTGQNLDSSIDDVSFYDSLSVTYSILKNSFREDKDRNPSLIIQKCKNIGTSIRLRIFDRLLLKNLQTAQWPAELALLGREMYDCAGVGDLISCRIGRTEAMPLKFCLCEYWITLTISTAFQLHCVPGCHTHTQQIWSVFSPNSHAFRFTEFFRCVPG